MPITPRQVVSVAAMFVTAGLVLFFGQTAPVSPATFSGGGGLGDGEVSVLDRYRLPIQGLKAEDFTVLEEGQARPIAAFTPVTLPPREHSTAKWMDDVPQDVQANDFGKEGRLVVILMDQ